MMQRKRTTVVIGFIVLLIIILMLIYFLCRNQTMDYQVPEAEIQQTGIEKIYLTSRQLNTLSTDAVSYIAMESEKAEGQRDFTNVYIAIQGGTSTVYPKKNYKIRLPEESDYSMYLKANYTDATLLRGSVTATLWADMVATEGISDLTFAPSGGSILGTPVLLYKNGQYHGIYFKTRSKSVENYCGTKKPIAVVFCKKYLVEEDYNDTIDFYALDSLWKNVYCQEGMEKTVEDSLSGLFKTAKQTSDEEFITKIDEHINLDTAIDYLLFLLFFQADDNYTKNIIWVTYDGTKWYPTAYDFDATFGLTWDGTQLLPMRYNLPSFDENGNPVSSLSLLWDRLLENNFEAVAKRYQVLRKDVLEENTILDYFYDVQKQIPESAWEIEKELWSKVPSRQLTDMTQIETFLSQRGELLDKYFELEAGNPASYDAWNQVLLGDYEYSTFGSTSETDKTEFSLYNTAYRLVLYGSPLLFLLILSGMIIRSAVPEMKKGIRKYR